jgi:hypothetical protein
MSFILKAIIKPLGSDGILVGIKLAVGQLLLHHD